MAEAGTTLDAMLDGRVRLLQPKAGYRAAIDPVLLAAAVDAGPGMSVLDIGAGGGAVALCLLARVPGLAVAALERDPSAVDLLRQNLVLNGAEGPIEALEGDLFDPPLALKSRSFDWVVSNPPFYRAGSHTRSPFHGRAGAHGAEQTLAAWVEACLRRARPGGRLALVVPAADLIEIAASLLDKAPAATIYPVRPRRDEDAKRVVVVARKGGRSGAVVAPALVLHEDDGGWTKAADAVLRHARPLKHADEEERRTR